MDITYRKVYNLEMTTLEGLKKLKEMYEGIVKCIDEEILIKSTTYKVTINEPRDFLIYWTKPGQLFNKSKRFFGVYEDYVDTFILGLKAAGMKDIIKIRVQ